jgi:hypothetical protein
VRTLSEEESLKFLEWNDRELGGRYFVGWRPFDHPQLGRVEVGGWLHMFLFRNPPPGAGYLERLSPGNCMFTLHCAAALPVVRVRSVEVQPLGDGWYLVRALVENQGYLPTNITQRALDVGIAKPVRVEICGPVDIAGRRMLTVGHLAGRSNRKGLWSPWTTQWQKDRAVSEWTVRGMPGTSVVVRAHAEKGGTHEGAVSLP